MTPYKYKTHLIVTDKNGNFKRYACNVKGEQEALHDESKVTCNKCQGMKNTGKVVDGYGFPHSKRL